MRLSPSVYVICPWKDACPAPWISLEIEAGLCCRSLAASVPVAPGLYTGLSGEGGYPPAVRLPDLYS
jgi:hypothetical protein